jgi:hypothetical protein
MRCCSRCHVWCALGGLGKEGSCVCAGELVFFLLWRSRVVGDVCAWRLGLWKMCRDGMNGG